VRLCSTEADFVSGYLPAFNDGRALAGISPVEPDTEVWSFRLGHPDHFRFWEVTSPSGEALATLGTYRFNGLATEVMSARTSRGIELGLPAQDLAHFEAMRWHGAAGDALFDLAGFSASPSTAKEAGIRRYKEKWGGRLVETSHYVWCERPIRDRLLQRAVGRTRGAGMTVHEP
jgi:hypothetical protein